MTHRILIVDDDPSVRNLLKRFLSRAGFFVATAPDGKTALEAIKMEQPHLILLDVNMPDMSGADVLAAAKEIDKKVGVIMISGDSDPETAEKMVQLGACGYISKPFDLPYLKTLVTAKIT